jgi:hypothetical protein
MGERPVGLIQKEEEAEEDLHDVSELHAIF